MSLQEQHQVCFHFSSKIKAVASRCLVFHCFQYLFVPNNFIACRTPVTPPRGIPPITFILLVNLRALLPPRARTGIIPSPSTCTRSTRAKTGHHSATDNVEAAANAMSFENSPYPGFAFTRPARPGKLPVRPPSMLL